jgi:glycosyltransferase involved in cell wall biosynthesis
MPHLHARGHRVYLLMYNACGSGGVARTVVNLANRLARTHEVELISLYRRRDRPVFAIDPRVRVTYLADARRRARGRRGRVHSLLSRRPTRLRPAPVEPHMSMLTDHLLRRKLRSLEPGILVSTRPSLHLAAVRFAPRRMVTVGQDHLNFPARFRNPRQAQVLRAAVPRLDAYTVLTNADAEDYRRELPGMDTRISVIRNASPWPVSQTPAALDRKVVVAAGRLTRVKGFRRMIQAYEPVARARPEWQLHIYGHGDDQEALERLIEERDLGGQVRLMGYTRDLRSVLMDSSVYAMTSHEEGFPMVLIEAMSTGLPLVSFDCPRGPGEIIDDGKNGRLVPDGDIPSFTSALLEVIDDRDLRRRLGAQALEDARQYEIDAIAAHWEELLERVGGRLRG